MGDKGVVGPNGAKGSAGMAGPSGDRGNTNFAVTDPNRRCIIILNNDDVCFQDRINKNKHYSFWVNSHIKTFRHRDVQPESSIIVKRNKHKICYIFSTTQNILRIRLRKLSK